tara:strand:+ start:350 stop:466 length:117 start_codon:yes stop_codon:yes gene_type:complete
VVVVVVHTILRVQVDRLEVQVEVEMRAKLVVQTQVQMV